VILPVVSAAGGEVTSRIPDGDGANSGDDGTPSLEQC